MKTKIYIFFLVFFTSLCIAQPYTWRWAKAGGGENLSFGDDLNQVYSYSLYCEEVVDLKSDSQSNSYVLSHITYGNINFNGIPINAYHFPNNTNDRPNVLLVKVDCQGNHLWHKVFGGGGSGDTTRALGVDANDNVYTSIHVRNLGMHDSLNAPEHIYRAPVHFDTDYTMEPLPYSYNYAIYNTPTPANKSLALIKYNSQGEFQWLRMPQSDSLTNFIRRAADYGVSVEADGTVHWLVGLGVGNHLNGALTVSDMGNDDVRYYILKYNSLGDFLGYVTLPITPHIQGINPKQTIFRYDGLTQQYYLGYGSQYSENIYIDNELVRPNYVACFNHSGQLLWKKESVVSSSSTLVNDLFIDNESNVYVSGIGTKTIFNSQGIPDGEYGGFGGYTFTSIVGRKAFVIKYDAQGNLLWGSNAGSDSGDILTQRISTDYAKGISVNGDEVAVGSGFVSMNWGNHWVNDQPAFAGTDPVLIRLNKHTGECIGINQIHSYPGYNEFLTAVDTDPEGNYLVGGFIRNYLFANYTYVDPIVGELMKGTPGGGTDFFVAKLAKNECGYASTDQWDAISVQVHPNPTSDFIYVESLEEIESYQIFNSLGQEVVKGKFTTNQIDLTALASSTYFIKITTQQGKAIAVKIIKK